MENDNYEIHVLSKVVPTIETVVLNMLPSCQDDLCPLRPQLYTSWTGGILAGKIPLRRDKCLAKVVPTGCQKNWFAFKSPANGPQTKVGLFQIHYFSPLGGVFGCEDAAQQVLMYVCLSVCGQSGNMPSYTLLQYPECMQNVREWSRMNAECARIFQTACRMFQNVTGCMQIHELACSYISLMQLQNLACSYISFHWVT